MKYTLYWWAKVGGERQKRGHDTFTDEGELDESDAEDMLEEVAMGEVGSKLPKFEEYYPLSDFPEDFGVTKLVRKSKSSGKEKVR